MTRFNIFMDQAIDMVEWALKNLKGSEIFVPKLKSFKVIDLIKSINLNPKIKIIGIRPGEKIHEELISNSDSRLTIDIGKYYVILPDKSYFKKYKNHKKLSESFSYNSGLKDKQLTVSQIKKLLSKNTNI